MRLHTVFLAALAGSTLFAASAHAQISKSPKSPRAKVTQEVGLGEVALDYGRPSVRGRNVFPMMQEYGAVWRTGANASTKITFSDDTEIGGEALAAGTYGLYTIPNEKTWTIIFNKDSTLWGSNGYDPAKDALRVEVPVQNTAVLETLTIDLQAFHDNGADLVIAWENVRVQVPVKVDTDTKILKEIDERVRNAKGDVKARTYYDAAMFLYGKNMNLEEAAGWMDTAVEMSPEAFWMMYYQAEMAHKMGNNEKALACAKKSLELSEASERGDFGYADRAKSLLEKLK